jgi:uncharacterized protein (TIGR00290 family)
MKNATGGGSAIETTAHAIHVGDAVPDPISRRPILVSWSGGKDSCMALYELTQVSTCEIAALLTTITEDYDRISMHGTRRELLEQQAASLGFQLHKVFIPQSATNEEYETRMAQALLEYRKLGIDSIGFGDLFLDDIRAYREKFLSRLQIKGVFPVWHRNTTGFIKDFIDLGFKAVITCVNAALLDQSFAGRMIDDDFLKSLPVGIDPCGENGEFHTFVFDGPLFTDPVKFRLGKIVLREAFWFRDLLPE